MKRREVSAYAFCAASSGAHQLSGDGRSAPPCRGRGRCGGPVRARAAAPPTPLERPLALLLQTAHREFIAERMPALERLPGYTEAVALLASFEGLDRYLAASGAEIAARHAARRGRRRDPRAALRRLRGAERLRAASRAPQRGARAARERRARRRRRGHARRDAPRPDDHLAGARAHKGPDDRPAARARRAPPEARSEGDGAPAGISSSCSPPRSDEPLGGDRARHARCSRPAARAAPVRRRPCDARRARLGAHRRRPLEPARARQRRAPARDAGRHRRAGGRAARLLQPRLPSRARTATSSPGRCAASSWAASATTPTRL